VILGNLYQKSTKASQTCSDAFLGAGRTP